MDSTSHELNLPIDSRLAEPARPKLTGAQYVDWWMRNLEVLERNGQLERMWKDPRRKAVGAPFRWVD